MSTKEWNADYEAGTTPWDSGEPEARLVEAVEAGALPPGRALEIGCGTGTNARYLAGAGWDVTAIDVAPRAIELARERGGGVRYAVHDLLAEAPPGGPYDLVFDRGCFHVFDAAADRARFAERVRDALRPRGVWLTVAGSTEGAPRGGGPPRRSARDLAEAIEPALEVVSLRGGAWEEIPERPAMWACLSRRREQPAQPSTKR